MKKETSKLAYGIIKSEMLYANIEMIKHRKILIPERIVVIAPTLKGDTLGTTPGEP